MKHLLLRYYFSIPDFAIRLNFRPGCCDSADISHIFLVVEQYHTENPLYVMSRDLNLSGQCLVRTLTLITSVPAANYDASD